MNLKRKNVGSKMEKLLKSKKINQNLVFEILFEYFYRFPRTKKKFSKTYPSEINWLFLLKNLFKYNLIGLS